LANYIPIKRKIMDLYEKINKIKEKKLNIFKQNNFVEFKNLSRYDKIQDELETFSDELKKYLEEQELADN
jgi:hypothetical protein